MTKLSVALCTYNGERYIESQLESILAQSRMIDEIIVSDDGSTDNTVAVVSKLADCSDGRIKIVKGPGRGLIRNSQQCVDLCSGDIIFIADQDDLWHPNKVVVMLDYFESHPDCEVLFTNADLIDGEGNRLDGSLFDHFFPDDKRVIFDQGRQLDCLAANCATSPTMAMRRNFAKTNPFEPYIGAGISNDYIIALLAAARGKLAYIDKPLISYRLHEGQMLGLSSCGDEYPSPITTAQMLTLLPWPKAGFSFSSRFDQWIAAMRFVQWRHRTKHIVAGPIAVVSKYRKYRYFYGSQSGIVMRSDAVLSMRHTIYRLRKKIGCDAGQKR